MTAQQQAAGRPRCLVIGGAGFVGQHLVFQLLDQGRYDVTVFDIRLLQDPRVTSIQGDLRQPSDVEAACKGMITWQRSKKREYMEGLGLTETACQLVAVLACRS